MHHHHHHRFHFHFHRERRDSNKGLERLYPLLRCVVSSLSRRGKKREICSTNDAFVPFAIEKKTDALSLSVPLPLTRTRRDSSDLKGSRRSKKVRFPLTAGQSRLVRAVFANDGNAADERSHLDVFEHRRAFEKQDAERAAERRAKEDSFARAKERDKAPAAKAPEEPPARKGWGWPWS